MILVCDSISMSYLNNILTLGYWVVVRLTLEVVPSALVLQLIKISSFGSKVPLCCVVMENGTLSELGSRIFSPFGGRIDLLHIPDCKGRYVWRRLIA